MPGNDTNSQGAYSSMLSASSTGIYYFPYGEFSVSSEQKTGSKISAKLYFTFIKKKFTLLQQSRLESRKKKLEKAFNRAIENGQEAMAWKFLERISVEAREMTMAVKGIKYFIEGEDLNKHKRDIRGGHISDTIFQSYTRHIPNDVLKKKKAVEDLFDEFIIYHYWNPEEQKDVKNMKEDEKESMKDPVLFGRIRENNRFYFIAEWIDEYCDLTFDEFLEAMGKEEEEHSIKQPNLD